MIDKTVKLKFLYEHNSELSEPIVFSNRFTAFSSGGTIVGPRINAKIVPGGGDFATCTDNGILRLDVKTLFQTDDDQYIFVHYNGRFFAPKDVMEELGLKKGKVITPERYYFRTTPYFETSSEKYSWLNEIATIGFGSVGGPKNNYKVYEIP